MTELITRDLTLSDGRTLRGYATDVPDARLTVLWHHGSPNLGEPPEPLFAASAERGIRWLGYDRPSYGPSTPRPNRDVASAAADAEQIAGAFDTERFAVMGSSGGGPHALACAALLPERVLAVVTASGLAPFESGDFDWYDGMYPGGAGELRAAAAGRDHLEELLRASDFDPAMFTEADHEALGNEWAWLGRMAGGALAGGIDGLVDDDMAFVAPWGFGVSDVKPPALVMVGEDDRIVPASHARWLATHLPNAELRVVPGEGHVSILRHAIDALDWLLGVS